MKKELEVEILYKEPKHLRVSFDRDILEPHLDALLGPLEDRGFLPVEDRGETLLRELEFFLSDLFRFLEYVEESAAFMVVPGMKQVYDDLSLLLAFLLDLPQQFVRYRTLMREIVYLAGEVVYIISKYDLGEMDQHMACGMVRSLNCSLKVNSHWMDLIRMIYGKQPKAPLVFYFVDYIAPLDAFVDPRRLGLSGYVEQEVGDIVLLRAILMDAPKESIEDDTTLKELDSFAREIGFTISSIDLKNMDEDMADHMCRRLNHFVTCSPGLLGRFLYMVELFFAKRPKPSQVYGPETGLLGMFLYKVEEIYAKSPKPSRMYYPKIGQLDFLDLLVGNLGQLLLKAKADRSICLMKFDIFLLQRKLQRVSCHLMEIPEPRKEQADIKDVITSIANLAYEAEDSTKVHG